MHINLFTYIVGMIINKLEVKFLFKQGILSTLKTNHYIYLKIMSISTIKLENFRPSVSYENFSTTLDNFLKIQGSQLNPVKCSY
jgi:hypothetical protein